MTKFSILDIGTQSIKHYIFSIENNHKDIFYYKRYSDANLGTDGQIDNESIHRNIDILEECMERNKQEIVKKTIATGTQILRTASNATLFCQEVKNTFGLDIKILSHEDEAFYLYKGLTPLVGKASFGAVNIGGGSTEIVFGTDQRMEGSIKIGIGVKTLKSLFRDDITHKINRDAMEKYLDQNIQLGNTHEKTVFITGVLDFYLTVGPQLGLQFTKSDFTGHPIVFDLEFMRKFIEILRTTDIETLKKIYSKDPGFVDNVAIGQTLYYKVAEKFGATQICPSKNDLTDGLIIEEVGI